MKAQVDVDLVVDARIVWFVATPADVWGEGR